MVRGDHSTYVLNVKGNWFLCVKCIDCRQFLMETSDSVTARIIFLRTMNEIRKTEQHAILLFV
jgi:cytidine deaminase